MPCGTSRGILEFYKVETEEALQEIIPRQVRLEPAEIGRREERKRKDAEVVGGKRHRWLFAMQVIWGPCFTPMALAVQNDEL